ncbi:MAG: hypothetical protein H6739_32030 [Alphaproteobacteria bacterium]|nr:hypothetical protein [Alphaproteobacteria bacterium]
MTMFCDPTKVGHFAVRAEDVAAGEPEALFRLLVATSMFQRRQDLQIMRVLQGIGEADARELSTASTLLRLSDGSPCEHLRSTMALRERCDLGKDAETKLGVCLAKPEHPCHLKRHTVLLKRYGHFGKVPSSIALAIREYGATDLGELRRQALDEVSTPEEAALLLEAALCRAWRVSRKIAHMYLSMMTNPDLCPAAPGPWAEGVDWTQFVVIDSNVDLFLKATGYPGPWTYEARRVFLRELARRVDLSAMGDGLAGYNPRLVQQALYLFMSVTNRRAVERDCGRRAPEGCVGCLVELRGVCGWGAP